MLDLLFATISKISFSLNHLRKIYYWGVSNYNIMRIYHQVMAMIYHCKHISLEMYVKEWFIHFAS